MCIVHIVYIRTSEVRSNPLFLLQGSFGRRPHQRICGLQASLSLYMFKSTFYSHCKVRSATKNIMTKKLNKRGKETNRMKRNLLFLMVLLSPLSTVAYDFEVDGIYYNYAPSTQTATVTYKSSPNRGYSGIVRIPDKIVFDGTTYSVTSIDNYAFADCSSLTEITIPTSITSIGNGAFNDCDGLTKVHISDLSAWCKINFEGGVFSNPLSYARHLYLNDEEITNLIIPDGVTKISDYAFSGCSGLTEVTIPNSVTSIGSVAFYICI